jgi:hypothetical protein
VTVTAAAPAGLSRKTWYGMPAYANADGKVVVFFKDAGKFSYWYSTLGFQRRRTSTTATCGRCRTCSKSGAPWWRKTVIELVKAAIS